MAWKRGRERVDSEGARVTRKSTMSTKRAARSSLQSRAQRREERERERGRNEEEMKNSGAKHFSRGLSCESVS